MVDAGVVSGYPDGTFLPSSSVKWGGERALRLGGGDLQGLRHQLAHLHIRRGLPRTL